MTKVDFNEMAYLTTPETAVIPYGTDDALEAAFKASGVTDYKFLSRDEALRDTPRGVLELRGMLGPMDVFVRSRFDPNELRELAIRLASESKTAVEFGLTAARANYEWHESTGQIPKGKPDEK